VTLWTHWLDGLDRKYLFVAVLAFVIAIVGLWQHYAKAAKGKAAQTQSRVNELED
jgi:hypothetical protein